MDFSKAFDTINYKLLVAKGNAYGFSEETPKLIFSSLKNRTQIVKINKTFGSWRELWCAVAHGAVLGPVLFNIYLNDFFFKRNKCL